MPAWVSPPGGLQLTAAGQPKLTRPAAARLLRRPAARCARRWCTSGRWAPSLATSASAPQWWRAASSGAAPGSMGSRGWGQGGTDAHCWHAIPAYPAAAQQCARRKMPHAWRLGSSGCTGGPARACAQVHIAAGRDDQGPAQRCARHGRHGAVREDGPRPPSSSSATSCLLPPCTWPDASDAGPPSSQPTAHFGRQRLCSCLPQLCSTCVRHLSLLWQAWQCQDILAGGTGALGERERERVRPTLGGWRCLHPGPYLSRSGRAGPHSAPARQPTCTSPSTAARSQDLQAPLCSPQQQPCSP